ncbi:MAG: 3'-5' exoribonuclease YhaM family protein [Planctomycetota bacterium]
MPRKYLRDLGRGDSVQEIFLVEAANYKQARNGSCFIQMTLRDSSGAMRALRWEANREEFRLVEQQPFLLVGGRIEEYQGNLQIIVDEMTSLSAGDAKVNPAEFLPHTKIPIERMQAEFDELVRAIPNPAVRRLVEAVLARPGLRKKLATAPAGKVLHHAYIGGLLEHVLALSRLADKVHGLYPWLDRSLLMAGVVLHDLGKTAELTYDTGFGYSDAGQLLGHITLVSSWIEEAAQKLGDIDAELLLELQHIVVSHHGKLEFGSPKIPMTAEALALHIIDNLDAKLAGFLQAFEDVRQEPGSSRWGEFSPMLGCRPFFPEHLARALAPPPTRAGASPRKSDAGKPGELLFGQ